VPAGRGGAVLLPARRPGLAHRGRRDSALDARGFIGMRLSVSPRTHVACANRLRLIVDGAVVMMENFVAAAVGGLDLMAGTEDERGREARLFRSSRSRCAAPYCSACSSSSRCICPSSTLEGLEGKMFRRWRSRCLGALRVAAALATGVPVCPRFSSISRTPPRERCFVRLATPIQRHLAVRLKTRSHAGRRAGYCRRRPRLGAVTSDRFSPAR